MSFGALVKTIVSFLLGTEYEIDKFKWRAEYRETGAVWDERGKIMLICWIYGVQHTPDVILVQKPLGGQREAMLPWTQS